MKEKYIYIVCIILIILVILAFCVSKYHRTEVVPYHPSTYSVVMPDSMLKYSKNEGLSVADSSISAKSKLIVWVDSTKCSQCQLDMLYSFDDIITYCEDTLDNKVGFSVIISPSKENKMVLLNDLYYRNYSFPIFIDSENKMMSINPKIWDLTKYDTDAISFVKTDTLGNLVYVAHIPIVKSFDYFNESAKRILLEIFQSIESD